MINIKPSIHPVVAQLVNEYAAEHQISNPQKIARICEKMTRYANGILKDAKKAANKGMTKAFSIFTSVHPNPKYKNLLSQIVDNLWELKIQEIKTGRYSFSRSGDQAARLKPYSIFEITWSDSNNYKYVKPNITPFASSLTKDFSLFQGFRKFNQFTDMTLICGETTIQAHKLVLAARSEVFRKAFTSGMKEGLESVLNVDLTSIGSDLKHFQEFIDFLYTDKILLKDRPIAEIEKTLALASLYQVDSLLKACVFELANQFNDEKAQGIYNIGCKYDIQELKDLAHWREYNPLTTLLPISDSDSEDSWRLTITSNS